MSKKLLKEHDVAIAISVSLPTLRRWRSALNGPPFIKMGATVRYAEEDVEAWLRDSRRSTGRRLEALRWQARDALSSIGGGKPLEILKMIDDVAAEFYAGYQS